MSHIVIGLVASFVLVAALLVGGMDLSFEEALLWLTGLLLVEVFGGLALYQQFKNRNKQRREGKAPGSRRSHHRSHR